MAGGSEFGGDGGADEEEGAGDLGGGEAEEEGDGFAVIHSSS